MHRIPFLFAGLLGLLSAHGQLINGSFEDGQGNPDLSGWTSSCNILPGPGAPGFGDYGVLVPHSNSGDCGGWSRMWYDVPEIINGETWTLSGWCGVFTFPFFSPYVGLRFGWREADGTLHFNTAALTNNGGYTYLSVTNTFTLADDDTVFIECEPGTASGMGVNQLYAMFDGLELTQEPMGVMEARAQAGLVLRSNVVTEQLWLAAEEPVLEIRIVELASGRSRSMPFNHIGDTIALEVASLAPGAHGLLVRTINGMHTTRFVKL